MISDEVLGELEQGFFYCPPVPVKNQLLGVKTSIFICKDCGEIPFPSCASSAKADRDRRFCVLRQIMAKHISTKKRNLAIKKTNGHCAYCGDKLAKGWHVDHMMPQEQGGSDHTDNLIASCRKCNRAKGTKTIEEFRQALGGTDIKFHLDYLDYQSCLT
jgi:5-methylcytosine-specific restriction endonuclease McrA